MLLWIASFRVASASNFLTVIIFSVPRGYVLSCRSEERSSRQFLPRSRAFAPSKCNPSRPWFWWSSSCSGLAFKRYLFLLTSREMHGRNTTLFDDSNRLGRIQGDLCLRPPLFGIANPTPDFCTFGFAQ